MGMTLTRRGLGVLLLAACGLDVARAERLRLPKRALSPGHGVGASVWSPDGTRIASVTGEKVLVYGLAGEKPLEVPLSALRLSWSPDGRSLAWADGEGAVGVFDALTGKTIWSQRKHRGMVAVAWSGDGMLLASGGDDLNVRVWKADGEMLQTIKVGWVISQLAWQPKGALLAEADYSGNVRLWDRATWKLAATLQKSPPSDSGADCSVAWRPDGTQLAASAVQRKEVSIWDARTRKLRHVLAVPHWQVTTLTWNPDGTRLAASSGQQALVWDTETGKVTDRLGVEDGVEVVWLAWSPTGSWLLGDCTDGRPRLWNVVAGL